MPHRNLDEVSEQLAYALAGSAPGGSVHSHIKRAQIALAMHVIYFNEILSTKKDEDLILKDDDNK